MCAGNVCSPLYLFSNKVGLVTSFQKVCRLYLKKAGLASRNIVHH